jgi:hypothetical protein
MYPGLYERPAHRFPSRCWRGVREVYPYKKWILRYDLSDKIIFYGDGLRTLNIPPPAASLAVNPGAASNVFNMTVGVSHRFK